MNRKFRVVTQLRFVFLLLAAMLVAGAGIGLWETGRMYESTVEIHDRELVPTQQVGMAMYGLAEARAQLLLALEHNPSSDFADRHDHPVERHISTIEAQLKAAAARWNAYSGRPDLDGDERAMLAGITDPANALLEDYAATTAKLKAGDFDGAHSIWCVAGIKGKTVHIPSKSLF